MASLQEGLRAHTVWLSQLLIPSPYSSLETTPSHSSHSVNLFPMYHSARGGLNLKGKGVVVVVGSCHGGLMACTSTQVSQLVPYSL